VSEYPEHDRQAKVLEKTHAIGDFLEWAGEHGYLLCRYSERFEEFTPAGSFLNVLAEYAGIDLDKIEAEKRAMLDRLREMNGG
jgi:hypothetical protein